MDKHLFELSELVIEAGQKIMEIYSNDFDIYTKQDESPVTEADQLAEKIILNGLSAINPDILVIAEELASEGKLPELTDQAKKQFYLVDPLDGTKEFINKRDEFTVNIALIENGKPVIGIIFAPALGTLYVGDVKQEFAHMYQLNAAFDLKEPTQVKDITALKAPNKPLKILASRSHINQQTLDYIKQAKEKHNDLEIMNIGSSLKLCLLAEGKADIYPRFGPTMEWDIAAGHAILAAAKGKLHDLDGAEFTYGHQENKYLNGYFIAYSN